MLAICGGSIREPSLVWTMELKELLSWETVPACLLLTFFQMENW